MNRWLAMYARSIVATLDFNANVNRPTKTVEGKEVFKLKVKWLISHKSNISLFSSIPVTFFFDLLIHFFMFHQSYIAFVIRWTVAATSAR